MEIFSRIQSSCRNLLRKRQVETELDAEIRNYVDEVIDEKMASGMPASEARRQALIECGGVEQVKQTVRESRSGIQLELIWQDLRYALRQLGRNRAFTWTAVIMLGLGIGATTSIFSAVYALLLRPLPYPRANQLIYIDSIFPGGPQPLISPDFVAAQHGLKSFSKVAGYKWMNANLMGPNGAVRVNWVGVTGDFLPMLGVHPQIGRVFRNDEDRPGGPAVILISNRFWHSYFDADPGVVGKTVAVDDREQTIIGVLPPYFSFPDFSLAPEIYGLADLSPDPTVTEETDVWPVRAIARLGPGVSRKQAQAEVQAFFQTRGHGYPADFKSWWTKRRTVVQSLQTHLAGDDRGPVLILLACVLAVLLIACINVANLQMARTISRKHEMAVRGAMGASRFRLIRQSLVESLTLSTLSATVGVGIAWITTALIRHAGVAGESLGSGRLAQAVALPLGKISAVIQVNGWILAFATGLALLTAFLFGIAPALSSTHGDLRNELQTSGRRLSPGRQETLLRNSLLIFEVCLAVVLLASAGLLIRSFSNVLHQDTGFDPSNTLTGDVLLIGPRYQTNAAQRHFAEQLLPRVKAIPGVRIAALGSAIPLGATDGGDAFSLNDPHPPVGSRKVATIICITPDYFRATGTSLLQGRSFTEDDTESSARVAIVNRAFARHYFQGNAVGKSLYIGQAIQGKFQFASSTIVGIVQDVRYDGIEHEAGPAFYVPMTQVMRNRADLILRSSIDPASLSSAMRKAVKAVDREQPVFDVQTMDEQVANLLSRRRLIMLLIACFALLAVFLSAVGIYGVFMYSVSRRKQEMGIRLALGSSRGRLVRLVVLQAARLIIAGGVLGIIVSLVCTRMLASMLVGVKPYDPLSFSLAWALMTLLAFLASLFPAVNAAQTDLISVLHSE